MDETDVCGICGVLSFDALPPDSRELVRSMSDQLVHRGPDSDGFHADDHIALGFRRLSIIDLSTGNQPISNEDGTVWIIFNGEIYNFQSLRPQLEASGHHFRSQTDTETIVHAYEQYGLDFVQHLRGMFAFAIWDARQGRLVLTRDRLGKKPLYYYQSNGQLLFASEMKALLQSRIVPRQLDLVALDEYLTYQYIPAPHTILQGVRKLPPGHLLVADVYARQVRVHCYWQLDYLPKLQLDEVEAAERLRASLTEAVQLRLISDVPLGALLSGGVDSSIVVGLMAQAMDRPVKTFSIGFEESEYNELPHAREIARRFGTDHREFIVRPEAIDVASKIVHYLDEPMADSSAIPTYYVAQMARQHVTVVLTGDGGDEAFAGYNRYGAVLSLTSLSKLPRWLLQGMMRPALGILPVGLDYKRILARGRTLTEVSHLSLGEHFLRQETIFSRSQRIALYTPELRRRMAACQAEEYMLSHFDQMDGLGPLDQMLSADTLTYLPGDLLVKMDRMTMAHSLEARSPFLDQEVVQLATRLPEAYKRVGNSGKVLLKRAFADLLPPQIRARPKQGFGVPLEHWFRHELREFGYEILMGDQAQKRGFFQACAVQRLLDEHQQGRLDHSHQLWALLVLELWHRQFVDQTIPIDSLTLDQGDELN